MTPDERQLLSGLFDRIRAAAASAGPMDREADAYIQDAMRGVPSAGYVLAQTVLVQQQALEAAAKHISELEARAQSASAAQSDGSFLGNIGRSLFGGAAPQPQAAPPAQSRAYDARNYERGPGPAQPNAQGSAYAPPPPQAGPWGAPPASGGGFLQGAMQTATGVAGGVLLGNALGGLFGGHGGGMFGGGFGGGGLAGGGLPRETINNYYESADPAGQHAQDVLQDMDQDQDDVQDSADDGGGSDDYA